MRSAVPGDGVDDYTASLGSLFRADFPFWATKAQAALPRGPGPMKRRREEPPAPPAPAAAAAPEPHQPAASAVAPPSPATDEEAEAVSSPPAVTVPGTVLAYIAYSTPFPARKNATPKVWPKWACAFCGSSVTPERRYGA